MRIIFFLFTLIISFSVQAQTLDTTHYQLKNVVYKSTPQGDLTMDIYYPSNKTEGKLPAVVLFFFGGWVKGNRQHFAPHSKYLASRGMIAITPDYRIKNVHGTTPQQAVMDARSAMRYVKVHADELGIDTMRLAAGGGSAGGHLALGTAILAKFDDPEDDLAVSPMPYALLLFNPVVNTTAEGFGAVAVGKDSLNLSPYHQMKAGLPPTLIFHGEADTTVPIENIRMLKSKMKEHAVPNQVYEYAGATHGFFNLNREEGKYFLETLHKTDLCLQSMGCLHGPPTFQP